MREWLSVELLSQPRITLLSALAHHWVILRCRSRTRTLVGYPGSPRGGCSMIPRCKEACRTHICLAARCRALLLRFWMAPTSDFSTYRRQVHSVLTLHIIFKLLVESPYTTSRLLKSYGIALIVSWGRIYARRNPDGWEWFLSGVSLSARTNA